MSLRERPLELHDIPDIASRLRQADLDEIYAAGFPNAEICLTVGLTLGPVALVLEGDVPVGVFGFTHFGIVWSFWSNLTRAQSREILARTPEYVAAMVQRSGNDRLYNVVMTSNRHAVRWLRASGCFDMGSDTDGRIHFSTKPELAECAIQPAV